VSNFAELSSGGGDAKFFVRWRGKQEGPYSASVIEAKLEVHEMGLLHEIFYNGQWVTIRDYVDEKVAALHMERQAREEQYRREKEETEKMARERDEQFRAAALAEEKRKNDLLAAGLERQNNPSHFSASLQPPLKPHRAGLILTLGLVGLFICGPLCLGAWVMGSGDLHEMDAGVMDPSGRSTTSTGRNLGIIGTLLWAIGVVFFLFLNN
jgi:hypothetical protein